MKVARTGIFIRGFLFVGPLVALAACGMAEGQRQEAPPPLVRVVTVQAQPVSNVIDLPGRIQAVRSAEIRARIDGIVEQRLYREGADVPAGAPLFRIDPRDAMAQLAQAQAGLRRAEARRINAERVVRRYGVLVSDNSVSAQDFDQAQAALRQADAEVAEARAATTRARLQLDYATVRSPIAGRAGIAQVTEGAFVTASPNSLLTTVEDISTVHALVSPSRSAVLDLLQRAGNALPVEVTLLPEDGRAAAIAGRLDFTSPTVEAETGGQVFRAAFPNPARQLLPGQFVRVRLQMGTVAGIVVPARAVQLNEQAATVSVLQRDGTLAARPVELGRQSGEDWIILHGLRPGERIVIEGWQNVRPGQKVRVAGDKAAAASAARAGR